jgi:hypothetical protein
MYTIKAFFFYVNPYFISNARNDSFFLYLHQYSYVYIQILHILCIALYLQEL